MASLGMPATLTNTNVVIHVYIQTILCHMFHYRHYVCYLTPCILIFLFLFLYFYVCRILLLISVL